VSAHYVVETGKNDDGELQLNVRFAQARSPLRNATPLAGARVRYPDGSLQTVDSNGAFDAGASSYAAKHGQRIGDKTGILVRILTPSGVVLQPTRFALYVPSAKTEANQYSYYREDRIKVTSGGASLPCEASYKQRVQAADEVVTFPIILTSRQQVVEEAVHSCDRGDPDKDARIVGFEFIGERDLIRWVYYYIHPVYSPRYVTPCGAQGC
jgi:hypothetical protein